MFCSASLLSDLYNSYVWFCLTFPGKMERKTKSPFSMQYHRFSCEEIHKQLKEICFIDPVIWCLEMGFEAELQLAEILDCPNCYGISLKPFQTWQELINFSMIIRRYGTQTKNLRETGDPRHPNGFVIILKEICFLNFNIPTVLFWDLEAFWKCEICYPSDTVFSGPCQMKSNMSFPKRM